MAAISALTTYLYSQVAEGRTLLMGIYKLFLRIVDARYVSIDMSKHARLASLSIFDYQRKF